MGVGVVGGLISLAFMSSDPPWCVHVCVTPFVQVIKILGTEKGKKNKSNLVFLAGNRVLKWMERSHGSEKALTALLKYAPTPAPAPEACTPGLSIPPARWTEWLLLWRVRCLEQELRPTQNALFLGILSPSCLRDPLNVPILRKAPQQGGFIDLHTHTHTPNSGSTWAVGQSPLTVVLQVWRGGSRGSSEKAPECHQAPAEGDSGGWAGVDRADRRRDNGSLCYLFHLSEFSHPFQNNLNLLRDLAVHTAHSLRSSPDWGGVVTLHR